MNVLCVAVFTVYILMNQRQKASTAAKSFWLLYWTNVNDEPFYMYTQIHRQPYTYNPIRMRSIYATNCLESWSGAFKNEWLEWDAVPMQTT